MMIEVNQPATVRRYTVVYTHVELMTARGPIKRTIAWVPLVLPMSMQAVSMTAGNWVMLAETHEMGEDGIHVLYSKIADDREPPPWVLRSDWMFEGDEDWSMTWTLPLPVRYKWAPA